MDKLKKKVEIAFLTIFLFLALPMIASADTTFFEGDFFIVGQAGVVSTPLSSPNGGGGGYCNSLWLCEEWSLCLFEPRSRTCIDLNGCNSQIPPLLLSCSEPLPTSRIYGCVNFVELDKIVRGWKINIYRFDVLDEAVRKWKRGIC